MVGLQNETITPDFHNTKQKQKQKQKQKLKKKKQTRKSVTNSLIF